MRDLANNTQKICRSHDEAISCLKKNQFCDLQGVFAKAASPLRHRCATQAALFKEVEPCLTPNMDCVLQSEHYCLYFSYMAYILVMLSPPQKLNFLQEKLRNLEEKEKDAERILKNWEALLKEDPMRATAALRAYHIEIARVRDQKRELEEEIEDLLEDYPEASPLAEPASDFPFIP